MRLVYIFEVIVESIVQIVKGKKREDICGKSLIVGWPYSISSEMGLDYRKAAGIGPLLIGDNPY